MNTPTGILEVNGIILTQEAIWQLEYLQSNGFISAPNKKFDNSGIFEKEKEISEVIFYITGIIANGSLGDDFSKEIRLLKIMYFMRDFYMSFKVPEDFNNETA